MKEFVILVNDKDEEIGFEEKLKAHELGLLHRAFSIFIFNDEGKMLLQRRAKSKYHSGGLWTNACCSHPRKGESVLAACHRRLQEEFGFDCPLKFLLSFTYHAHLDHDLQEHEFDHVYTGIYNGPIDHVNPEEIEEYRWIEPKVLLQEVRKDPESFTTWFRIIYEKVLPSLDYSTKPTHLTKMGRFCRIRE